jgi:hypothetical protein
MVGDGAKVVYEDEKPIAKKLRKNNTLWLHIVLI